MNDVGRPLSITKEKSLLETVTFKSEFTTRSTSGIFLRGIITIGCLPYKAYLSLKAISKTIYRLTITHKNLLEWTTSE